ncbi:hypothetical protein BGZ60DRAFT_416392 [Tricladium varicosporioides]|nr:hypothetical protein BGZ60DRAFT_416392 [Hymenoscyphus varicosporioides]
MPRHTRKGPASAQISGNLPLQTFHQFSSLPLELRLQIWNYLIHPDFIPVHWSSTHRVFYSPRRPPSILYINQESRHFGLKHYQLALAASPEFARVYVNFKIDLVYLAWHTLGATDEAPGRLGRKLCESDYKKLEGLMIHENDLLRHMDDEFREITKFKNLRCIAVVCDEDRPESGDMYGEEAMMEMADTIDNLEGPYMETWPELICLRGREESQPCSRHWWFDGWNQRTRIKQKEEWTKIMAECLEVTLDDTGDSMIGPGQFFFNMMIAQALGGGSSVDEDEDDLVDSDDLALLVSQ